MKGQRELTASARVEMATPRRPVSAQRAFAQGVKVGDHRREIQVIENRAIGRDSGGVRRQISADDPYRAEVTGLPSDGTAQRTVYRQGNQNLEPEEAKTWVAGLVLDVPKVRGLSLSFDYFHMNQNKVIENVGGQAAIDRDEIVLALATQAELAKGTNINQIDLGSGTAAYKGSSKIVRKAVTDADRLAFAAYNAQQTSNNARRAVVGELVSVIDDYLNLSGRDIQGYEFGAQWRSPKTSYGQFTFNGEATHYVLRRSQADETSAVLDELDRNGRVKWRANGSVSWRLGGLSAGWFTSYFGSTVDTSAATTEPIYRALGSPSYIRVFNDNGITRYVLRVDPTYNHNVWASYRFAGKNSAWLKGVSVAVDFYTTKITDAIFNAGGANAVCTQIGNDSFAWFGTTGRKSRLNFLDLLRGKIAKWWMPDDVMFVDDIPLGPTGKTDKKALRLTLADYELPAEASQGK